MAVIQPGAADQVRRLPAKILKLMVRILIDFEYTITIITREEEPPLELAEPKVRFETNLPVPDTLCLVQQASLFIGSYSSLSQLAWFNKIPNVILWPDSHPDWRGDSQFSFGRDYDNTLPFSFRGFDPEIFKAFLKKFS